MSRFNRQLVIGHIGQTPEARQLDSGGKVWSFTLATDEGYSNPADGKWVDKAEWHNIVLFDRTGRWDWIMNVADKGDRMVILGKVQTRSYDDKELRYSDGRPVKHYRTELVAEHIERCYRKPRNENRQDAPPPTDADAPPTYNRGAYPPAQQPAGHAFDDFDPGDLGAPLDMDDAYPG